MGEIIAYLYKTRSDFITAAELNDGKLRKETITEALSSSR
jgi:hypothetical protein